MAQIRGRRSISQQETESTFYIEIQEWKLRYSFSLKHEYETGPGPCSEYATIEANGTILSPKKYKGRSIEIYINTNRYIPTMLVEPTTPDDKQLLGVGEMFLRGEQSQIFCSVPFDVMPMLTSCLHDEEIKYMSIHAEKLHYGRAAITSVNFEKDLDQDSC